jgi:hypothetical protein
MKVHGLQINPQNKPGKLIKAFDIGISRFWQGKIKFRN